MGKSVRGKRRRRARETVGFEAGPGWGWRRATELNYKCWYKERSPHLELCGLQNLVGSAFTHQCP